MLSARAFCINWPFFHSTKSTDYLAQHRTQIVWAISPLFFFFFFKRISLVAVFNPAYVGQLLF